MPKPNMKKFGRTAKFKQHHFSVADGARGSGQDQPEKDVILVEDEDGDHNHGRGQHNKDLRSVLNQRR